VGAGKIFQIPAGVDLKFAGAEKERAKNFNLHRTLVITHTNNGLFKLVEALLQIHPCFFSHSIQNYVPFRYQQTPTRCIAYQDVCVQQSHAANRLLPLFEVNL